MLSLIERKLFFALLLYSFINTRKCGHLLNFLENPEKDWREELVRNYQTTLFDT